MRHPDFRDLLFEFNAHKVEYLLVGAHALAAHGLIRATKDLDVWVRPNPTNARQVIAALIAFGAALYDLTIEDLSKPGIIFQIGFAPVRIDVITVIDGVEFEEAWQSKITSKFDDQEVYVMSHRHLIINKRASGRSQDLVDVAWLEKNPPQN